MPDDLIPKRDVEPNLAELGANTGPQLRIGHLCGWKGLTVPLVDWDKNPAGPIEARLSATVDLELLHSTRHAVELILLVSSAERSPIILTQLSPSAEREVAPIEPHAEHEAELILSIDGEPVAAIEGSRLTLEAADEIVLSCGAASITMRRNGRISIRGAHVETYATGVNRIKGAAVQIN